MDRYANFFYIHFLSFTSADIRHPEELSLLRPLEEKKKKKDKDSTVEIYDLTEVPLSSGTLTALHSLSRPNMHTY